MTASASFIKKFLSMMTYPGRICGHSTASTKTSRFVPQKKLLAHTLAYEQQVAIREPYLIFQHWLNFAKTHAPQCKPHMACMATVDKAGEPVTRMTTIEEVNASGITFFTCLSNRQAGEICTNPHISLHFNWPVLMRSVRIAGCAKQLTADQSLHQFRKYPRHVQLSISTGQPRPQENPKYGKNYISWAYEKLKEHFGSVFRRPLEEVPMPANWGGFLLKPSLYEFGSAYGTGEIRERMRFRRCLALPRGKRSHTINADCYDWVYDTCIEHA